MVIQEKRKARIRQKEESKFSRKNKKKRILRGAADMQGQLLINNDFSRAKFLESVKSLISDNDPDSDSDSDDLEIQKKKQNFKSQTSKKRSNARILIVDDNQVSSYVLRTQLEQYQFEIDTAMNGNKAVELVRNLFESAGRTYNLILMDYDMPVLNGIEATKIIRQYMKDTAPNLPQPFICCITSYNDANLKNEAIKARMNSFAVKPIFKSCIQKLLIQAKVISC